ncbi:MAG: NADP-dependent phosphogluconate dehydrogenase [Bacteroidota bacterium]
MITQKIYFICGVSSCGKSTIGTLLAKKLGATFIDGDDFHPESNIQKMASGHALNDEDRFDWLKSINAYLAQSSQSIVVACSALKEKYRKILVEDLHKKIHWIFLLGSIELISDRMRRRENHFMPSTLLQSQFDILEVPDYAIKIDIKDTQHEIINKIIQQTTMKNQLGLIGLGVMGKSLSRNFASRGVSLSLYNRYVKDKEENVAIDFIQAHPELKDADGFENLNEFVASLQSPRKIFLMISAGAAVDSTIDTLIPLLDKGDLIIDGGNSHYKLTQARNDRLAEHDIFFIGTGVSGGEEGALKGPSIMPGGEKEAYQIIQRELEAIAAKDKEKMACCGHIGKGGAGHFVKMVHNGIEYAEMQLIAEIYGVLKTGAQLSNNEISDIFSGWLKTDLSSYLLEITVDILRKKEGDKHLIDIILDKAGNKGTGSWTTIAACELGVPVPTLTAALFARYQSAFKSERTKAESVYRMSTETIKVDLVQLQKAYKMARIINHHQGIHLIQTASDVHEWKVNLAEVARIWTNGCIIRSQLMEQMKHWLNEGSELLLQPTIIEEMKANLTAFREIVGQISKSGISIPCFQASYSYFETYTRSQSTANIIQGQRDYFGAHRYQRKDDPSEKTYHTIWNS